MIFDSSSKKYGIILLVIFLLATLFLSFQWSLAVQEIEKNSRNFSKVSVNKLSLPLAGRHVPKQIVKGLYLTAYSAGSPAKIDEIIKLIEETELNAIVIDIKDYSGLVLYDSQVPLVKELKTKESRIKKIPELIKKLHDHKIYVIARQTVFQDPILAEKKPEWAIRNKSGGIWHDRKGLTWVDPRRKEVWNYNLAIAKEAAGLGFDEINFDYVRFPTDGNMAAMVEITSEQKYITMGKFYRWLSEKMIVAPAWISLDMFGMVMERKQNDGMQIGQRLEDAVGVVDYICPMMYPSHYPSGHLKLANPAANAYAVLDNGVKAGEHWFVNTRAKLRPWLQAFDLGAIYSDGVRIREQIDAVEKYPNAGWLLWNASNRYTAAGLKKE